MAGSQGVLGGQRGGVVIPVGQNRIIMILVVRVGEKINPENIERVSYSRYNSRETCAYSIQCAYVCV